LKLNLFESKIAPLDPPSPKPHLEPNMKWIRSAVAEIWPFAYLGGIWNPILGEGDVVGGQRWHR